MAIKLDSKQNSYMRNTIIDLSKRLKDNKSLMNGMLFSMFSFIDRGISFLLLIILARYIMPAEYGQLALFTTIVQLLDFFVALQTQGFFSISYFQHKGEQFRQDTSSISVILVTCTTLLGVVLFIFQDTLSRLFSLPTLFIWYALIASFINIYYNLFKDYLRIQEKVVRYGILSIGFALMNFVLSIFLVVNQEQGWEGRIYASVICTIVFGVLGFFVLYKSNLFAKHITWNGTKMILLWGIPLIPHTTSSWLKQGCDRLIINGTHTIEDVGVFSFALTMTSIILMIGSAFNSTNSVSIFQILSTDDPAAKKLSQLKRQTRNIGIIYTISYVLVLLFGTALVPIFLPRYSGSLPYFWILSLSGYFFCLYFLFVNYLFYYHRNKNIMMITFFTSLVHLGLSLLLTRYSLYYTAIIHVFSQLIVLLLIVRESQKVIREEVVGS